MSENVRICPNGENSLNEMMSVSMPEIRKTKFETNQKDEKRKSQTKPPCTAALNPHYSCEPQMNTDKRINHEDAQIAVVNFARLAFEAIAKLAEDIGGDEAMETCAVGSENDLPIAIFVAIGGGGFSPKIFVHAVETTFGRHAHVGDYTVQNARRLTPRALPCRLAWRDESQRRSARESAPAWRSFAIPAPQSGSAERISIDPRPSTRSRVV